MQLAIHLFIQSYPKGCEPLAGMGTVQGAGDLKKMWPLLLGRRVRGRGRFHAVQCGVAMADTSPEGRAHTWGGALLQGVALEFLPEVKVFTWRGEYAWCQKGCWPRCLGEVGFSILVFRVII